MCLDAFVEGLHGLVGAADVEVLADDGDVEGVGEVGVEDGGDVAVGENLFDLVAGGVGGRHGEIGEDGWRDGGGCSATGEGRWRSYVRTNLGRFGSLLRLSCSICSRALRLLHARAGWLFA